MRDNSGIVVLGAGNMATRLSLALVESGYTILQVFSRTMQSARLLATRLGRDVAYTDSISEVCTHARFYLFSISDDALPDLVSQLPENDALWLHTAGSMPMEIFAGKTRHYGVLYPMQTVSKERETDWSEVPVFIEASTSTDLSLIENLARSISRNVQHCNSSQRRALHLAAVFACNFTNHMYAIAEKLLQEEGLDFDVMKFLIRETERKAEVMSPREAQTGPATRCDKNVMNKHLELLAASPEEELYALISKNIERYKKQQFTTKQSL